MSISGSLNNSDFTQGVTVKQAMESLLPTNLFSYFPGPSTYATDLSGMLFGYSKCRLEI
jgi:hypothetical protein